MWRLHPETLAFVLGWMFAWCKHTHTLRSVCSAYLLNVPPVPEGSAWSDGYANALETRQTRSEPTGHVLLGFSVSAEAISSPCWRKSF